MTAGEGAASFRPRAETRVPRTQSPLWALMVRLSPRQGWATFVMILFTLLVVGQSVSSANWVETPGLFATLLLAAFTGLVLAKIRLPAVLLHPVGILLGALLVVLLTSTLMEDQPGTGEFNELWDRLKLWYDAAANGGISTDLIPFTMGVLGISWIIGYISSWFIFRSDNVWVGVVVLGTAILTVLSFLPKSFAYWFFVFTFFAMVLVVRMSVVQVHEVWQKTGRIFDASASWRTLHATAWVSLAVILLAWVLPLQVYKNRTAADTWNRGRAPVEFIQDEFARLFSGIPSRKDLSGRFFGKTLPFLGKISFGGEVVFWAESEHPAYWLSATYSEYTPKGWKVGGTESLQVGPNLPAPPREDALGRVRSEQSLQLSFDSSNFLSGGTLDWISEKATVQTLRPKQFEIDLVDASEDKELPQEIAQLATELRAAFETAPAQRQEAYAARFIPDDLRLVAVTREKDNNPDRELRALLLERKAPASPDVVAHKFARRLTSDQAYAMVSYVSVATDDQLRGASTDYSSFITDHYLQLPSELPERVSELANRLARDADTPLDKALAVRDYLRSPNFTYAQDIDRPPKDADGVDNFLFETKRGYSDYFGSSMAVLLRSVGVPARMAAGYGPGEVHEDSGLRIVRDSDSHGWVQVYFPGYGWIDFEPTPAFPTNTRVPELPAGSADDGPLPDVVAGDEPIDEFLFEEEEEDILSDGTLGSSFQDTASRDYAGLAVRIAILLTIVGVLYLVLLATWNLGLGKLTTVERAYAKMSRLGSMAGVRRGPQQTPAEYGETVAGVLPAVGPAAQQIGWAFATRRYSSNDETEEEDEQIEQAWKSLRARLFGRVLSRLLPISSSRRA